MLEPFDGFRNRCQARTECFDPVDNPGRYGDDIVVIDRPTFCPGKFAIRLRGGGVLTSRGDQALSDALRKACDVDCSAIELEPVSRQPVVLENRESKQVSPIIGQTECTAQIFQKKLWIPVKDDASEIEDQNGFDTIHFYRFERRQHGNVRLRPE